MHLLKEETDLHSWAEMSTAELAVPVMEPPRRLSDMATARIADAASLSELHKKCKFFCHKMFQKFCSRDSIRVRVGMPPKPRPPGKLSAASVCAALGVTRGEYQYWSDDLRSEHTDGLGRADVVELAVVKALQPTFRKPAAMLHVWKQVKPDLVKAEIGGALHEGPAYIVVGQELDAHLRLTKLDAFDAIALGKPTVVVDVSHAVANANKLFDGLQTSRGPRAEARGRVLSFRPAQRGR